MSRVILQPTGNKDARENYVKTLENPVDIIRIKPYLTSAEFNYLSELYPNGLVPTWGVTAGKNNVNINKWNKVQAADVAFFSANRVLYSYGFITLKLHNKNLAQHLWGNNSEGQTWEYIYFLDEIREQDIPISQFNEIVRYAKNYKVQGFTVLDEDKSNAILSYFDLESEIAIQPVSEVDYKEIIKNFDLDELDIIGKIKSRAEQGFLRKALFGNKTIVKCGICAKEYPISFLVAAHIKKRSFCSNDEKLDVNNIVMPMCKFGCDDLYEKGYITVINGRVTVNDKTSTEPLKNYLNTVEELSCEYWNNDTKKYFEWHRNHHGLSKVK
ncbi:HNH endonuclease [Priestia megaterium]